jgi:hypothetical protein
VTPGTSHLTNHDQSGVYPETYRQSDAFVLFQTEIEGSDRMDDCQPSTDCSVRVIFMGLRVAKVDQQPIPQILGDIPGKALDHVGTGLLVGPYHLTVVFRVELFGKGGGAHEVTEHDRELAAFGLRRMGWRGWSGSLGRRLRGWLGRWGSGYRGSRQTAGPHQHPPIFIHREFFGVDQVVFERFQHVVIELEAQFENPIGKAALLVEHREDLGQDAIVVHDRPSTCASAALRLAPVHSGGGC